MRADLHIHTRISDGSAGIEHVISMAKNNGIHCIAITDHDTVSSFSRSKIIGERYGVKVLEAVEFSCYDEKRNRKVHILCYNATKPDRLVATCNNTLNARKIAGQEMAKKVMRKYPISAERITKYSSGSQCIYKQHLMQALMDAGYSLSIYGEVYEKLFKGEDSYNIPIKYPEVREVLDVIHSSGGLAVLAHPFVYDSIDLMEELIKEKRLDGIEVWHPKNKEGNSEFLLETALENDLIPTGGSDFHGMYNSVIANIGKCYTPNKYLELLFKRSNLK